ncbi:MAG: caspase family protein [Pseudomonadota bacterium]
MRRLAILAVLFLLSACSQQGANNSDAQTPNARIATQAPRLALLIGNGEYQNVWALPNPANDARAVASALSAAGYVVFSGGALTDLTADEMRTSISTFGRAAAERGGIAFVYYAGHGVQLNGVNYLIPTDAEIASTDDIQTNAVSAQDFLSALSDDQIEVKVIVLDACRDLPFEAADEVSGVAATGAAVDGGPALRSLTPGLSQLLAPPGALVAFSTGPGAVAKDGPIGGNSPYAEAMVEAMRRPGLRFEDLFIAVRNIVRAKTQGEQTPWETSSLTRVATFQGEAGQLGGGGVTGLSALTSDWDGRYEGFLNCERSEGSPGYEEGYWIDIIGGRGEFGLDLGADRWSRNELTIVQGGGVSVYGTYKSSVRRSALDAYGEKKSQFQGSMRRGTTTMSGRQGDRRCKLSLRYISSLDAPRPTRAAGLPADAVQLSGEELRPLFLNKTYAHANGLDLIYFEDDNTGIWRTFNGGAGEKFAWSIDGDVICNSAVETCAKLYRSADKYYFVTPDNVLIGRYSLKDGKQLIFFAL